MPNTTCKYCQGRQLPKQRQCPICSGAGAAVIQRGDFETLFHEMRMGRISESEGRGLAEDWARYSLAVCLPEDVLARALGQVVPERLTVQGKARGAS